MYLSVLSFDHLQVGFFLFRAKEALNTQVEHQEAYVMFLSELVTGFTNGVISLWQGLNLSTSLEL